MFNFINSRLTGPRGLDELCNLFKDDNFKAKGYEVGVILNPFRSLYIFEN